MFTGWERPSHWLVLAVVVLVLFGYKKLPDATRSIGRSLRIFKTEMKGMSSDDENREATEATAASEQLGPEAQSPPPVTSVPAAPATPAGSASSANSPPTTPVQSTPPTGDSTASSQGQSQA